MLCSRRLLGFLYSLRVFAPRPSGRPYRFRIRGVQR
nr:MAG TPA: hypothetical protein [Caudoviricetes sp.]